MHTARNKKSESVVRAKQNARKWVIFIKHINLVALVKYEYLWPDRQINYNFEYNMCPGIDCHLCGSSGPLPPKMGESK